MQVLVVCVKLLSVHVEQRYTAPSPDDRMHAANVYSLTYNPDMNAKLPSSVRVPIPADFERGISATTVTAFLHWAAKKPNKGVVRNCGTEREIVTLEINRARRCMRRTFAQYLWKGESMPNVASFPNAVGVTQLGTTVLGVYTVHGETLHTHQPIFTTD